MSQETMGGVKAGSEVVDHNVDVPFKICVQFRAPQPLQWKKIENGEHL